MIRTKNSFEQRFEKNVLRAEEFISNTYERVVCIDRCSKRPDGNDRSENKQERKKTEDRNWSGMVTKDYNRGNMMHT